MKRVFAILLILLLMITNSSYAMQPENFTNTNSYQEDSNFDKVKNHDSKKVKISDLTITKEKSEKTQPAESIILSGSSVTDTPIDKIYVGDIKDISVTDDVYKNNLVSISSTFTDLSITSLTAKPGITYPPFNVGQSAIFQYKIANHGNTTASNTSVGVKVNGTLIGSINVGNLLGGYIYIRIVSKWNSRRHTLY